ncbi:NAD(P)/FAD-dependent oxidoreductase [Methylomonas sp. SURF-2]|uniref:NAD(P)/FAD-dependent oxidoreductase n=1 Tax=Methylomonas subterranea TaxID=2952225 RepID=A0ABT1TLD3_9GAMM|nr:NAD(P)/FAD-dependent oxidoreductase [Methylomonas sp. SURF-2]MCQ8106250.1 NAD(P)/FAD-dependent oxidoreductase [Methylomonas sp. SURF-2]
MRGVQQESRHETYDVIVIGAGIGGLSTAALLAKAGKSVLLVERHDRPGGYAHSFKRRGFHFDSGVHLVSGCGPRGYRNGSSIYQICTTVGIEPREVFIPLKSYARAVYPELEISLRAGESDFIEGLCEHFPKEKDNLLALIRLCKLLAEEAMLAETVLEQGRETRISPATALANLFRYRRTSLHVALDEFLSDPQLKSLCASLWPYLGLPPAQLSFLYWACMMAGYTYEGGYYCRGSFQNYANALAAAVEKHGGEVLLNASARRIVVNQGKVAGILLENGQLIRASSVVSNTDALQTAELLLGREYLPKDHFDRLNELSPSTSIFVSYVATDLPMAHHSHESFFFESLDHEAAYASNLDGDFNWFSATLPSLTDPSLAPAGQHIMLLTTLCPFDIGQSWRQAKKPFEQRLLKKAERFFPGLRDHLLFVESGTPRTLERYTLNRQGAAYGFAASPEQIGPNRPGVRGVLPGLFHTGHWSRPGGGVAGVSVSALLAADAVLNTPA